MKSFTEFLSENHEYKFTHEDKGFITNTPRGYKVIPKMVKDMAKDGKVKALHVPTGKTYKVDSEGNLKEDVELEKSKMSELHATISDHMDKHIDEYNRVGGAEALMGHAHTAALNVAKIHNISADHAKKFVSDYIDSKLNEEAEKLDESNELLEFLSSAARLKSLEKQLEQSGYERTHSYMAGKYSTQHWKHTKTGDRKVIRWGKILDHSDAQEFKEETSKVKDRKTGKYYNPYEEIDKMFKNPDYVDQMKRMGKEQGKGWPLRKEEVELDEAVNMSGGEKAAYRMGMKHGSSGQKRIDAEKSFGVHSKYYHMGYDSGKEGAEWHATQQDKSSLRKEEVELDEGVSEISKGYYEHANGKRPSGKSYGWLFSTVHPAKHSWDKHKEQTYQHSGKATFSDAAKAAVKHFKEKGHVGDIHVLS